MTNEANVLRTIHPDDGYGFWFDPTDGSKIMLSENWRLRLDSLVTTSVTRKKSR